MMGLLHCVAQFMEHRMWPYEYTLEIATFCLEVIRKHPAKYGKDLVLVSVICLGFVGVGLLEALGGKVLGKGHARSSIQAQEANEGEDPAIGTDAEISPTSG